MLPEGIARKVATIYTLSAISMVVGTCLILLASFISFINNKFAFYFTLLYENPHSEYLSPKITFSLFVSGYSVVCLSVFSLITTRYCAFEEGAGSEQRYPKLNRSALYYRLGVTTVIVSTLLLAFPGQYLAHGFMSGIAVFLWMVYTQVLVWTSHLKVLTKALYSAAPIPFLFSTMIIWIASKIGFDPSDFVFSLSQYAMSAILVFEFLYFFYLHSLKAGIWTRKTQSLPS